MIHDKTKELRDMLKAGRTVVVGGAHNGLSAKLVEEAGFEAIWASGFEISASHGVPDANILTMAENLEAAKQMNAASRLPVVADCDNGYGNAINVIRTVEAYEGAGISAICIEDNVFPKRCSFYVGVRRDLSSIEEHAGKIKAAKETQRSESFMVIARTEALIAGWGMDEALKRADAYVKAGADAILIHSKKAEPDEIFEFARRFGSPVPLVAVPTIYKKTTVEDLAKAGFGMVIFANHGLRASIKAMRETLTHLRKAGYAASVDDRIVALEEVYQLIGVPKMKSDESAYLPAPGSKVKSIVIAAGHNTRLSPLTDDRPTCFLDIKGKTLLERAVASLNAVDIKDIAVVLGWKREAVSLPSIRTYENPAFEKTGELASLFAAEAEMNDRFVFLYGDILFDKAILDKLLKSPADIALVVDRSWDRSTPPNVENPRDFVVLADAPDASGRRILTSEEGFSIKQVGPDVTAGEAHGEFIGMAMFSENGVKLFKEAYKRAQKESRKGRFHSAQEFSKAAFTDLVQDLIDRGITVKAVDIYKGWMEIDTFDDYKRAWSQVKG